MKIISFKRDIEATAIRNRVSIIDVVLQANELLLEEQYRCCDNIREIDKSKPFFYVEKMSRLFIPESNDGSIQKIYSIVYPFMYNIEQTELSIDQNPINPYLNSCLKSIIAGFNGCLPDSIEKTQDSCLGVNEEYPEVDIDLILKILTKLITFDAGYIRYDYDEEHEKGVMHPLHHLDINYSNQSTYKIGLKEAIDSITLKEILDIKNDCWFINPTKK